MIIDDIYRLCPRCNQYYIGKSEIADDNKTLICHECKIDETMEKLNIPVDKREKLKDQIKQYEKGANNHGKLNR